MPIAEPPSLPAGYTLREATVDDAAGVAGVFQNAYPDDTQYPLAEVEAAREMLASASYITFVVDAADEIAATATIRFDSVYQHNAEICKLAVVPAHQGQGLARGLLQRRLRYLEAIDHRGPIFSAAVTEHPHSQRNLHKRGFQPVSFHKAIQSPFFGSQMESQAIVLHEASIDPDDRTVYVPESLQEAAEVVFSQFGDQQRGREIAPLDVPFPDAAPVVDRTKEGSDMGEWYTDLDAIDTAIRQPGPDVLVAVDANDPDSGQLYTELAERGFTPAGVIPDWLTDDGTNRDAVVFQYLPADRSVRIAVIDGLKTLLDALGYPYTVRADGDGYWELTV